MCVHVKYFNKKTVFLQSGPSAGLPTDLSYITGVLLPGDESCLGRCSQIFLFNMISLNMMGEIVGTREKAGALTPESGQSLCQLKMKNSRTINVCFEG